MALGCAWGDLVWVVGKTLSLQGLERPGPGCQGSGGVPIPAAAQKMCRWHSGPWFNGEHGGGAGRILESFANLHDSVFL